MNYGTSHLLIGVCVCVCVCVGGYFQEEGQEKILLYKGGGHYMKNKNIDGRICFFFNLT